MNIATLVIAAALLIAAAGAVIALRRAWKNGGKCSGGCEGCTMRSLCRK